MRNGAPPSSTPNVHARPPSSSARQEDVFMRNASLVVALVACGSSDRASPPSPPASVTAPVKEGDLATVTLTEAAAKRLAIATAKIERRDVARTRTYPASI